MAMTNRPTIETRLARSHTPPSKAAFQSGFSRPFCLLASSVGGFVAIGASSPELISTNATVKAKFRTRTGAAHPFNTAGPCLAASSRDICHCRLLQTDPFSFAHAWAQSIAHELRRVKTYPCSARWAGGKKGALAEANAQKREDITRTEHYGQHG